MCCNCLIKLLILLLYYVSITSKTKRLCPMRKPNQNGKRFCPHCFYIDGWRQSSLCDSGVQSTTKIMVKELTVLAGSCMGYFLIKLMANFVVIVFNLLSRVHKDMPDNIAEARIETSIYPIPCPVILFFSININISS